MATKCHFLGHAAAKKDCLADMILSPLPHLRGREADIQAVFLSFMSADELYL